MVNSFQKKEMKKNVFSRFHFEPKRRNGLTKKVYLKKKKLDGNKNYRFLLC